MADQSPDSKFLGIVGPTIGSALGAVLGWLTGESSHVAGAVTTGLAVVGGICALAFSLMYRRCLGVLASGGTRKGSPARAAYDALRESLFGENVAARIYSRHLRAFLDWIERSFGDVGMADHTLFRHFLGLKTTAPLWTAPAFARCLLLALIYPIATIFLIWAISGHVGPAEAALGLAPRISGWRRAAAVVLILLSSLGYWRFARADGWVKNVAWLAVALSGVAAVATAVTVTVAVAVAVVFAFAGVGVGAVAVAFTFAVAFGVAGASASAFAGAVAGGGLVAFVFAVFVAVAGALAAAVALAVARAGATLNRLAIERRQHGTFLAVFVTAMLALVIALPALVTSAPAWDFVGPPLLFIGLLTLINGPFDWASLGLTRVLLHRGLELGGWWPYLFALIDAALAAVIITALAASMVIGIQALDTVAVHGGGKAVLQLRELFDGAATRPSEPEYWWLYALLISSMIPSLLNLAIGGVAFVRGVPVLRSVLLGFLPAGKAVPPFDRAWIALVLTAQTLVGVGLGVAAQAVLAIGIVGYVLPWLGLHILDVARDIADFNLPERVWALFTG